MTPLPLLAPAAFGGNEAGTAPFRPAELLQLALLGSAVRGVRDFDALIADVRSMAGAFWQPDEEVVLAGLQALSAEGALRIAGAGRPRHMVVVHLSDDGASRFEALMMRDIGELPEPLFHAAMMVKIALIDALSPERRWWQIADLLDRLQGDLHALREQDGAPGLARLFEQSRLEGEIAWLGALAVTADPAAPPRAKAASG